MHDVLELVGRLTGRPLQIQKEASQKGDMRDTAADTSEAQRDLGFRSTVSLAQGLAREWDWIREA